MFRKNFAQLTLWQFENLSLQKNLLHYVSTRSGGKSSGPYESLNLSYAVKDDETIVTENRKLLAYAIGVSHDRLKFPIQTHSANVGIVDEKNMYYTFENTDALITSLRNYCIAILIADCVPLLLYDRYNHVAGCIHAGWKGTVKNIVQATITKMQKKYNTKPEHLMVAIGPSISPEVYETGEEVADEFRKLFGQKTDVIHYNPTTKKPHVNLWLANKRQLMQAGVPENNIEIAEKCTYMHHAEFYSARKNTITGRFAAGIMLL